jgi:hypothetical protein
MVLPGLLPDVQVLLTLSQMDTDKGSENLLLDHVSQAGFGRGVSRHAQRSKVDHRRHGTPASFWCAEAGNYRIARGIDLRDKLVRTAYWPLTRPIVSGR